LSESGKNILSLKLLLKDKPLISILIIALVIRIVVFLLYPDQLFPDATAYRTIGQEIFTGKTITNNIYMPLYPILSYVTGGGIFQTLFDITISVLSVWLIFVLSFQIFNIRLAALFSAAIAAIYPHFIFYSLSGLTETVFTFLILLALILLYRKDFIIGSCILVLSILVRPTFDLLNPVLIVLFASFVHTLGVRSVIKYLGLYCVCYVLIMSPWWLHQYEKYGEIVRLNLGDGIILYSGNNPLNQSGGGIVGDDVDMSSFITEQNPIVKNNLLKEAAISHIIENPTRFIELAGLKFMRLWRLWPHTSSYQQWYIVASSILSYGFVLFCSIGYAIRNSKPYLKTLLPIFSMFAYLTIVHMITIGSIRYRFPLEPFLVIFTGYFMIDILKIKNGLQKL
jgi:hypothetical protein